MVVHRVGQIRPGEAIVLVAALAAHRGEAFEAVRMLMDYLKTDAPLWKKETGPGGARWIEPTDQDHARRKAGQRKGNGVSETLAAARAAARCPKRLRFRPLHIAVMTVSDTRDEESDTSGKLLAERVTRDGHVLAARAMVKDDVSEESRRRSRPGSPIPRVDVVVSTGGTGLTGRDVTPEAIAAAVRQDHRRLRDRLAHDQLPERGAFHHAQPRLRRACRRHDDLRLPGSNGACKDGWDKMIRWQLDSRHRPCNLAELTPRFLER